MKSGGMSVCSWSRLNVSGIPKLFMVMLKCLWLAVFDSGNGVMFWIV